MAEFVRGYTLAELMETCGSVSEADVASIMRVIVCALERMHLSVFVYCRRAQSNVGLIYGAGAHKQIVVSKLCNLDFITNVFPPLRHSKAAGAQTR